MKIFRMILIMLTMLSVSQIAFAQNVEYVGSFSYGIFDLKIRDNYAFCGCQAGMIVVDISDPSTPSLVSSLYIRGCLGVGIDISGDYAYLTAGVNDSLYIINISDPANLSLTASLNTPSWTNDVSISDNYAYVAEISGLLIANISNATHPTIIGFCDTPGYAFGVFVLGNYSFIADDLDGLEIIDISNHYSPSIVGSLSLAGHANKVFTCGTYAYVATSGAGVNVVNVEDPTHPSLSYSLETTYYAYGVDIWQNYLFVADAANIEIYEISNPLSPIFSGSYNFGSGYATKSVTMDNYIYVATSSSLQILRFNPTGINDESLIPNSFSLSQNYPNPFNASTSISYSLSKSGPVNLSIYNLLGQKVATLSDGIQQAGGHSIIWNAGDCPSGVYFVRLEAGGQTKNIKMVLMK